MVVDSVESNDSIVYWAHPTEHWRYASDSIIGIHSIIILDANNFPVKYISLRNQYFKEAFYNKDGTLARISYDTGFMKESTFNIQYRNGDIVSLMHRDSTTGATSYEKFWYDTTRTFTPYYANEKQVEGLCGAAFGTNFINVQDFSKHLLLSKDLYSNSDSLISQTNFSYTRADNEAICIITKSYWDKWAGHQIVHHNLHQRKE